MKNQMLTNVRQNNFCTLIKLRRLWIILTNNEKSVHQLVSCYGILCFGNQLHTNRLTKQSHTLCKFHLLRHLLHLLTLISASSPSFHKKLAYSRKPLTKVVRPFWLPFVSYAVSVTADL